MRLSDAEFNKALEIFQEFGPRRCVPVRERWTEAFPNATREDFAEWEALCREIEHFAYGLAEQVLDSRLEQGCAIRQIGEKFPRSSRDRVAHTYSQPMYLAMK